MKSFPLFIVIALGFILSFKGHHVVAMYPLSAVIFYFYLPVLYSYSRINVFGHIEAREIIHIRYYPTEFILWLLGCSFFSFILAHLLADKLFNITHLHFFILPLILGYLAIIIFREIHSKKLHAQRKKLNFERQGRLLSFEILFIFTLLFSLHQQS